MSVSREITHLRKAGDLEGAYRLATEAMKAPRPDIWLQRAYGWALIMFAEERLEAGDEGRMRELLSELKNFSLSERDELFEKRKERTLALGMPGARELQQALGLVKAKQHSEALKVFRRLYSQGYAFSDYERSSFGWSLYHENQRLFGKQWDQKPNAKNISAIRYNLRDYLNLGTSRLIDEIMLTLSPVCFGSSDKEDPYALLHRLILIQAQRLAEHESLNLTVFLKMWNPSFFSTRDYLPEKSGDREYPSLAKKVIRTCAKQLRSSSTPSQQDVEFLLPLLKDLIKREPDDIWLQYDLVHLLNRAKLKKEAMAAGQEFVRKKPRESWAWGLLASIAEEDDLKLSCLAKALACPQEDTFLGKIRLDFARLLSLRSPNEARYELELLLNAESTGKALRQEAEDLSREGWFQSATAAKTGLKFYEGLADAANELILAGIPWLKAVAGAEFTTGGKDGKKKKRRKRVLIDLPPIPIELSMPLQQFPKDLAKQGTPIWLRAEMPDHGPPMVHGVRAREGAKPFDILREQSGVVDHVNQRKKVFHFIVSRELDATHPLEGEFKDIKEGDFVAVRLARHRSRDRERTSVVSIRKSNDKAAPEVYREFRTSVKTVTDRGFAFSECDIFIPDFIASPAQLGSRDTIAGAAVLNFDRKKSSWGWRALKVKVLKRSPSEPAEEKSVENLGEV